MEPLIPYFEPVRFQIGDGLYIQGAGMMVVTGFLIGGFVTTSRAKRLGLSVDAALVCIALIIVGTVVGGHLGYQLLYEPGQIVGNPVSTLRFWEGQLSFGGFAACTALCVWYLRQLERVDRRLCASATDRIWAYCDCIVKGLAIGLCAGRIGCFVVHDHPGIQSNFWLAVYGTCPGGSIGQACHDVGLYEAILLLLIFIFFLFADRQRRYSGFLVGAILIAYGAGRFLIDFLRHPLIETRYLGLTTGQFLCIVFVVGGVGILTIRRSRPPFVGRAATAAVKAA